MLRRSRELLEGAFFAVRRGFSNSPLAVTRMRRVLTLSTHLLSGRRLTQANRGNGEESPRFENGNVLLGAVARKKRGAVVWLPAFLCTLVSPTFSNRRIKALSWSFEPADVSSLACVRDVVEGGWRVRSPGLVDLSHIGGPKRRCIFCVHWTRLLGRSPCW